MKIIAAGLAAHYALDTTTVAACIKVTRRDSTVLGVTSTDHPIIVSGITYTPGFNLSSLQSTETLGVDTMELTILPDELMPESELLTGVWDNAAFEIFEVNYEDPADGVNVLKRGWLGEVGMKRGQYTVELRSLAQALQQTQGIVTSKTCRARFCDAACGLDVGDFTVTGTVDSAADRRHVTDAARVEPSEEFAEGLLSFTTGNNAGFQRKIKVFSGGVFTFSLPFPFDIDAGDQYSAVVGCQKRLAEDCVARFDNALNFQGEPHLPGLDRLTSKATTAQEASTPPVTPEVVDYTGSGP